MSNIEGSPSNKRERPGGSGSAFHANEFQGGIKEDIAGLESQLKDVQNEMATHRESLRQDAATYKEHKDTGNERGVEIGEQLAFATMDKIGELGKREKELQDQIEWQKNRLRGGKPEESSIQ